MAYHFISIRMAKIKDRLTNVGEDMEKLELYCIANGTAPLENSLAFSQNVNRFTI